MKKLKEFLFGESDESFEAYVKDVKARYNLKTHPLLASNRKANPEQLYTKL